MGKSTIKVRNFLATKQQSSLRTLATLRSVNLYGISKKGADPKLMDSRKQSHDDTFIFLDCCGW